METALGNRTQTYEAIRKGASGLKRDAAFNLPLGRLLNEPKLVGEERLVELLVRLGEAVLREAGLAGDDSSLQLILSTTKGDIAPLKGRTEEPLPDEVYLSTTATRLRELLGAVREPIVVSNACISGLSALIVGRRLIEQGVCRHALVLGGDLVSEFIVSGFFSFKSLDEEPCRPYDVTREGLTLGEAVGALLLTSELSCAEAGLVRLDGGVVTNDANHISGPSRSGDGLYYAISGALEEAGLDPEQVGMVNTHGTATRYNDEMESHALFLAGLDQTPTNSVKGSIGHTLGASGVVETILVADELRRGEVLGTKGLRRADIPCPMQLSGSIQPLESRIALKTASGFGGCNAAVVLSMEPEQSNPLLPEVEIFETAHYTLPQSTLPFADFIREQYRALEEKNMKFYKMSDLAKGLYVATMHLLKGRNLEEEYGSTEVAVVLANRSSSLDADCAHQRIIDTNPEMGASPATFVYTLPNVAVGELCIRHKIQGDNTFFIEQRDAVVAECYGRILLETGRARAVVTGRAELSGQSWEFDLKLLETK